MAKLAPIDARLSDCVAYGFTGGPEYSTLDIPMDNGYTLRNGQWLYPRHRYSAVFQSLPPTARDELLAAFHVARGRLRAFRFKDWNDYQAVNAPLAPAVGTSEPVQLTKTYEWGGETLVRRCRAPNVVAVVRDGTPVAGSFDPMTGMFTPDAAWAAGVHTWTGEFDVWVTFAEDYNPITINNWRKHTATVELVEDKAQ